MGDSAAVELRERIPAVRASPRSPGALAHSSSRTSSCRRRSPTPRRRRAPRSPTELETWQGPGVLVVAGNLVDPSATTDVARLVATALDAHDRLRDAIRAFCAMRGPPRARAAGMARRRARRRRRAASGSRASASRSCLRRARPARPPRALRRVVVETARPDFVPGAPVDLGVDGRRGAARGPGGRAALPASRLRYRGLRRLLWIAPLVALLAIVATHWASSSPVSSRSRCAPRSRTTSSQRVGTAVADAPRHHPRRHRPRRARRGGHGARCSWRAATRSRFATSPARRTPSRPCRPRRCRSSIVRATCSSTGSRATWSGARCARARPLSGGFLATPGATAEVVRELPGALGLPSVFLPRRTAGFLELEAGAEVRAPRRRRRRPCPRPRCSNGWSLDQRRVRHVGPLHVALVAAWPTRPGWPVDPDVLEGQRRQRLVRRIGALAILLAGVANVAVAVSPPLRSRLHAVLGVLPIGVSQTAAALLALTGVALIMLARGVRRGQHRAWLAAILVLAVSVVGHVGRNASVPGVVVSRGGARVPPPAAQRLPRALRQRLAGDRGALPPLACAAAVAGAVIGVEATNLRRRRAPSLWLVSSRSSSGSPASRRSRCPTAWTTSSTPRCSPSALDRRHRPVPRHPPRRRPPALGAAHLRGAPRRRASRPRPRAPPGLGTLDYFALRDDKQWFFHRDTLVAYAVYGGVCLVSPDPSDPLTSARTPGVRSARSPSARVDRGALGAGESWLPLYAGGGHALPLPRRRGRRRRPGVRFWAAR